MHIGLVIYGSLDTVSGGYLYDRKLVEYLERQGDTVEIISVPWRNYPAHLTDNWNRDLYRKLKEFRGDILLQDELNHPSLFLLNRRLIASIQYPIVSIVHHLRASEQHPAWLMPFYRSVERAYLRTLDGFIFNSRTTKKAVENLLSQEVDRYVVAPPGGDRLPVVMGEETIRRRGNQSGPLRLLFVGNVIPRKGLHTVLEALSFVDFGWALCVVGELRVAIKYANGLMRFVNRRGWEKQVQFLGPVDDQSLIGYAAESHVFVMPSSYEGFGIAYLEGMGFGLPAIGTTSGAAAEIISDSKDGFLIAPGDARTLAEKLVLLDGNRALLIEMGLAARRRFEVHPAWEISMADIRDFLTRLFTNRRVLYGE